MVRPYIIRMVVQLKSHLKNRFRNGLDAMHTRWRQPPARVEVSGSPDRLVHLRGDHGSAAQAASIRGGHFRSHSHDLFACVDGWYNRQRLYPALGCRTPTEAERRTSSVGSPPHESWNCLRARPRMEQGDRRPGGAAKSPRRRQSWSGTRARNCLFTETRQVISAGEWLRLMNSQPRMCRGGRGAAAAVPA